MSSIKCAYAKTINDFLNEDNYSIVKNIKESLSKNGIGITESHEKAWMENADALKVLFQKVHNDFRDSYIAFEVFCPYGGQKRIDCMLFGKDRNNQKHIVHIELKQWKENVDIVDENGFFKKYEVNIGSVHDHPSKQARNYQGYLESFMPIFENNNIKLNGYAYCYNYTSKNFNDGLFNSQYNDVLIKCPLYIKNTMDDFVKIIENFFICGHGKEVFNEFITCKLKQTNILMNSINQILNGNDTEFKLLGDQVDAMQAIINIVKKSKENINKKYIVICSGGPGTGKTLIALKVLGELSKKEWHMNNLIYATRSSALRDTLKAKLKAKNNVDASHLISDSIFHIYPKGKTEFNSNGYKDSEIDVLIVDEAHRLEKSANSMGTGTTTYLSQIISLIYCSKVLIFFIDDHQITSSKEIGQTSDIINIAKNYINQFEIDRFKFGNEKITNNCNKKFIDIYNDEIIPQIKDIVIEPIINLKSQFRCNGSDNYIDWIDKVLYNIPLNGITIGDDYKFGVFESPFELETKIRELNELSENGARIVAGYDWTWSDDLMGNGDLKKDVKIGNWAMPWETKSKRARGDFQKLYADSAEEWAYDKRGINQIGCVPSCQGFEFEYVGVILGPDILYDPYSKHIITRRNFKINVIDENGKSIIINEKVHGGGESDLLIKNIYRVLMTRGKKGCYIYCYDKNLNDFFRALCDGWKC